MAGFEHAVDVCCMYKVNLWMNLVDHITINEPSFMNYRFAAIILIVYRFFVLYNMKPGFVTFRYRLSRGTDRRLITLIRFVTSLSTAQKHVHQRFYLKIADCLR